MDVLRHAICADLPAIFEGEQRYMREVEPAQLDAWNNAISRNLALWIDNLPHARVIEDDARIVGYAIWRPAGSETTLITINVVPERRRRGIADRLMREFIDVGRAEGRERLRLGVLRANPATALYEHFGFRRVGDDGEYDLYELQLSSGDDGL